MPFRFMPEEFEEDVYEPKAVAPVFAPPESPAPPPPPGLIDEEPNPYREIARPMMDELMAARKRARTLQSGAMISRGGDRIAAAIGGIKPDYSAAESLEAQAKQELDNPIREMQATGKLAQIDAKFQDLARKARDAREAQDPLSAASRRAQDFVLASGVGKHLGEDVVRRMSVEDLKRSTPVLRMAIEADQDGWRRQRLENKDAWDREHDQNVLDARKDHWRNTEAISADRADYQNDIERRSLRNQFDQNLKATKNYAGDISALTEIERIAPGLSRGVVPEGYALNDWAALKQVLPGQVGRRYSEQEANALKSALVRLQTLIRHKTAGANLTESERADYNVMFADALMAGPAAQAAALDIFRKETGRKLHTEQWNLAHSQPEVFREYSQATGHSFLNPLFSDVIPGGNSAAKPQVPTSTPVREPAATPGNYTRGGKVMLINRSTGQAMWASPEVATKALASGKYREVKNDQEYQALGGAQ